MAAQQFKSIAAAAATGAGVSSHLGLPMPIHSMQVVTTGVPTGCVVDLEGSLDGTNWFLLVRWDITVQANKEFVTASAFAGTNLRAFPVVSYVRANLTTLSGGTAPTVTATIASFGS